MKMALKWPIPKLRTDEEHSDVECRCTLVQLLGNSLAFVIQVSNKPWQII